MRTPGFFQVNIILLRSRTTQFHSTGSQEPVSESLHDQRCAGACHDFCIRSGQRAVWHIVKGSARRIGVAKLAPHDLRRTCARLCHASGGELEQIQFLLGHVSVHTTERCFGANSGFDRPSMIALASSRILELGARLWKVCRRSTRDAQVDNHRDARNACTSRIGGFPKKRLYSRLNWLGLSYPTAKAALAASSSSVSIFCRAVRSRSCF